MLRYCLLGYCAVDLFSRCVVKTLTQETTTLWTKKPASLFPHKSLRVRLQVASQPIAKRASDQGVCCYAIKGNLGLTRKQSTCLNVIAYLILIFGVIWVKNHILWFICSHKCFPMRDSLEHNFLKHLYMVFFALFVYCCFQKNHWC